MNIKKLTILVVLLVGLIALFFYIESANHSGSAKRQEAFPDIADQVAVTAGHRLRFT